MKTVLFLILYVLIVLPASAAKPSAALQVELQNAMLSYTDSILVDGGYSYLDTKTDSLTTVYPANTHPFVVTLGENYFVCSEFITEAGDTITADYLVRQIGEKYSVVQMILDDRDSLKKAMKKYKKKK
ncbi:MAG: hypothetical protein KTR18_13855 [Acidiferrobacterales bacterium]|nr:hypothetical protein [Acidiferrobacterales bacterium]